MPDPAPIHHDSPIMTAIVRHPTGPYADAPLATLVLHIHREVLHHGAEIALLRDLYRAAPARV